MRNLILLSLMIPLFAEAQKQNVITLNRLTCKMDKVHEFEKALRNHAQKYHSGTWKWRVFNIESGPDAGGYQVIEGPASWNEIDNRGDLGDDHTNDWKSNVMPLIVKNEMSYVVFREEMSTVEQTDYTDKIAVNHIFPKPGKLPDLEKNLNLVKPVWEAAQQTMAVYESSSSGPQQIIIVTRYKQGLKERERDFRKPFKERFVAIHGEPAFEKYFTEIADHTERQWSEMMSYNPNLSSK